MNKTISINIGGFVFHIEEDAYVVLRTYLQDIANGIPEIDIRTEAMQDIEARIAEIFKEKLQETRTEVVTLQHVHLAQSNMGSANEITGQPSGDRSSQFKRNASAQEEDGGFRRLYRDPDDRIIGGVCAGLGHFFGVDPIWFRAAFAFALIAFGSGLLLYLVLLIIMPKAITTAQKLEMRGRPVNLNEIGKRVQVAVDDIESAAKDITDKTAHTSFRSKITRFFDGIAHVLTRLVLLFGKFLAAILWFVAMVILVSLLAATFAVWVGWNGVQMFEFNGYSLFAEGWTLPTICGLLLMLGAPAFGIVYKTTKILFGIKGSMPSLKWILSAMFLVGFVLFLVSLVVTAKEFKTRSYVEAKMTLSSPVGDTLYVTRPMDMLGSENEQVIISTPYYADTLYLGEQVDLDLKTTPANNFEILQRRVARGEDKAEAQSNANAIQYAFKIIGDTVVVPPTFKLEQGVPYRNQKLKLIIQIPYGKSVYIDEDLGHVIRRMEGLEYDGHDPDWVGLWHSGPSGFTRVRQESTAVN